MIAASAIKIHDRLTDDAWNILMEGPGLVHRAIEAIDIDYSMATVFIARAWIEKYNAGQCSYHGVSMIPVDCSHTFFIINKYDMFGNPVVVDIDNKRYHSVLLH